MRTKTVGIISKKVIPALLCLSIGLLAIYFAIVLYQHINLEMHKNCKVCSILDKDCPYTMKELDEQEYGSDNRCNDMGFYEMQFKIGVGGLLVVASVFLFRGADQIYQVIRKINT